MPGAVFGERSIFSSRLKEWWRPRWASPTATPTTRRTNVILDSELTIHAPRQVTAACGMDALSHVVEGAVSDVEMDEENMRLSQEGVRLIFQHLPIVMKEPENIESRLAMCRAAMYGGNAINTCQQR